VTEHFDTVVCCVLVKLLISSFLIFLPYIMMYKRVKVNLVK